MATLGVDDDPMKWSIDRVVQELCSEDRTWIPSTNRPALPQPSQLEASLREHLVDGECLLEDSDSPDFFTDLNVKPHKHKATIRLAIRQFRERSLTYGLRQQRRDGGDDVGLYLEDEALREGAGKADLTETERHRLKLMAESNPAEITIYTPATSPSEPEALPALLLHPETAQDVVMRGVQAGPVGPGSSLIDQQTTRMRSPSPEQHQMGDFQAPTEEPKRKKRRIAPNFVSSGDNMMVTGNMPIGTLVDNRPLSPSDLPKADLTFEEAYIGSYSWTWAEMTDLYWQQSDEGDYQMSTLDEERPIPQGKRRLANRIFKRRFLGKRPLAPSRGHDVEAVTGTGAFDRNEIIPAAYENSDDEESYDSETWAEIQAEKNEPASATFLDSKRVEEIIDNAIKEHVAAWLEKKQAKLERMANKLWCDARRMGQRRAIEKARTECQALEARLERLRYEITRDQWSTKDDLEPMLSTMHGTIEDREMAAWTLAILKHPKEPKKFPMPSRTPRATPRQRVTADGEEEILTSESEDDPLEDTRPEQDDQEYNHAEHIRSAQHRPEKGHLEQGLREQDYARHDHLAPEHQPEVIIIEDDDDDNNDDALLAQQSDDVAMIDDVDHNHEELLRTHSPLLVSKSATHKTPEPTERKAAPREIEVLDLSEIIDESPDARSAATPQSVLESGRRVRNREKVCTNREDYLTDGEFEKLSQESKATVVKLFTLDEHYVEHILDVCARPEDIWSMDDKWRFGVEEPLNAPSVPKQPKTQAEKDLYVGFLMLSLLETFIGVESKKFGKMTDERKGELKTKRQEFKNLVTFMSLVAANFRARKEKASRRRAKSLGHSVSPLKAEVLESAKQARLEVSVCTSPETQDVDPDKKAKKQKPIVRDKAAQDLRETTKRRIEEQEARRRLLRAKLAASSSLSASQKGSLIINESKQDHQGLIFVHDNIAGRIKKHQVDGVRFLWNQIVDSDSRQGCLLAHSMGLGKTMQVVTFLVAIAGAAASEDPSISSQIPEDLKVSRTLILAPAGLVKNWEDELLLWAPEDHHLGAFYKIDTEEKSTRARINIVREWATNGGVLVVGYDLFMRLRENCDIEADLEKGPNIVIADEAHVFKNPNSKNYAQVHKFRTHSRIAMTGSPLANNVVEYHALINWVAPNFLSDMKEFRQEYAKPIEAGLSMDSVQSQRRMALTKLRALEVTVSPKVHRRTMAVLKHVLPPKHEFLISVPLTPLQRRVYEQYLNLELTSTETNDKIFGIVANLHLLCNHPCAFRARLEKRKTENGNQKKLNLQKEQDRIQGKRIVDWNSVDADDGNDGANSQGNDFGDDLEHGKGEVDLPMQLVSQMLAVIPKAGITNESLSWKIPVIIAILEESKRKGDRVLVFSQSLDTLDYLALICRTQRRSYRRIDGSTATGARQNMVKEFNQQGGNNQADLFLISTRAGGVGLNITGANRVIILDVKWNPQFELQAIGRTYRIGQQKPVYVYRFICGGTLEDGLMKRGIFKMQLAGAVVDKKNHTPKGSQLEDLIQPPTDPKQQDLTQHRGKDEVLDKILDTEALAGAIRSIVMMESYEEENREEDLDHVIDKDHYEQLVIGEEARRNGGRAPELAPPASMPPVSPVSMHQVPLLQSHHHEAQSWHASSLGTLQGTAATSSEATSLPQVHPVPLHSTSHPGNPGPGAPVTLPPIPGASTKTRASLAPSATGDSIDTQSMIREELTRLLTAKSATMLADARRRASDVAEAFRGKTGLRQEEVLRRAQRAILEAAEDDRFAKAISCGLLSADSLSNMGPEQVMVERERYARMTKEKWIDIIRAHDDQATVWDPIVIPPDYEFIRRADSREPSEAIHDIPRMSRRADDDAALQELHLMRMTQKSSTPGSGRAPPPPPPSTMTTTPRKRTARDPFE